jgi:hypothetical protein
MHTRSLALALVALAVAVACTSTKVTQRQTEMQPGERLARPDHIIVNDFSASPQDVAPDSAIAAQIASQPPPTQKELELGRQLGASVAKNLVAEIQKMGLPAVRAAEQPTPDIGDIVIRGYFVTVDKGSTIERVAIGFGAGDASLTTVVEGYLATETGLQRLGEGEIKDGGAGKGPGMVVPLAVTLATANPIGLAVGGAVKAAGELSGHDTIEGSGKRTAELIAKELKIRFQQQGWIE